MMVGGRPGLLQQFRLLHAIAESGVPIAVPRQEADRFEWLDRYFDNVDWGVSRKWHRQFADFDIDHASPRTRLGEASRPLVFPHQILDRCRTLWTERTVPMSFVGLVTEERRAILAAVCRAYGDGFVMTDSAAGRQWPSKGWDEDYFTLLGRSQFVACPDGDYVWTYRFFEACMCGAIPVVQTVSPAYDGFQYYRLTDPPRAIVPNADWVAHNAALVRVRLTVPHVEIRRQLIR